MRIRFLSVIITVIISFAAIGAPTPDDKMKAEDVVAKHLASIGTAEDLSAVKSLIAVGTVKATAQSSALRDLGGPAQLASQGDQFLVALLFNSTNYPHEKVAFDGQKLTFDLLPEGKRTLLYEFLRSNDVIVRQGLLGGTLSTAWPLLNIATRNPKLEYSGTEKVNDRQAHKLKYYARKGGGGLQISLYFDAETFQHVRTEYKRTIPARMGPTAEQSASQLESHYRLTEDFSDFRPEGKLTLPHMYRIRYSDEARGMRMYEWVITLSQFAVNEQIDPKVFSFDGNK